MRPLRTRLQEARQRHGLPWEVLERDYLLSWVLAGIQRVDVLNGTLVFKGGTALKKCFFGDYRFSEDLDFTGVGAVPGGVEMDAAMQEACHQATELLDPYAPVEIVCERHVEREPHPGGQAAFDIHARMPWQRQAQTNVMVEISINETLLRPPLRRAIIHDYGEPFHTEVLVYSLEEIVAEKLRAILQHARLLERRGWVRSRVRDYYDLWRILGAYGAQMDLAEFPAFLHQKCAARDVTFSDPDSFFPNAMLAEVEKTWRQWLGPLVPDLPTYETVMNAVRSSVAELFAAGR